MQITEVAGYDKRRRKVVLDGGEVVFLLYEGECRRFGIRAGDTLSEEVYQRILAEILLPRAKKRLLYALKTGDKTKQQLTQKLRAGFYPPQVITAALSFLENLHLLDDSRYAENFVSRKKESCSRKELTAKLMQKGIGRSEIARQLADVSSEDEYAACKSALEKRCSAKRGGAAALEDADERRRIYGYLARRGYSFDLIERVVRAFRKET